MLDRRMHILLDEQRRSRVAAEARRRGTSVADVIRDAIDRLLPRDVDETRRRAIRAVLDAEPSPVPRDPHEIRAELDEAHDRSA